MAAVITSTGTWSGLDNANPTTQAPGGSLNEQITQQEQGVVQDNPRLSYRDDFTNDTDGVQEIAQFAGLVAKAYGVGARAALVRMQSVIRAMLNTEDVENRRVFQP